MFFCWYVDDIDVDKCNVSNRDILDYASDSSTDEDVPTVANRYRGNDVDNSDNESIDSQNEDVLKWVLCYWLLCAFETKYWRSDFFYRHAEVFTTEEVTRITKEKLMRLRNLYMEQLCRLKHVLREKRRKYMSTLKVEKESLCKYFDTFIILLYHKP